MASNIAKSFANMTLLYWAPIVSGSGMKYAQPVEFKGKYIGNAQLGDGSPGTVAFSGGALRDNLVLFYLCKPEVEGYVCWSKLLEDLDTDGTRYLSPDQIEDTHKIRSVTEYVMPGTRTVALANQAFIAGVM